MGLLAGKTAIITGASKGIGKGIAEVFAQQGANVAFTFLSSVERGQALEEELKAHGANVKGYRSDASKMQDAEALVAQVVEDFGGVDIVVNNAGITKDTLLMRMTEEDFNRVIEVNLNSVFNMTKAVQRTFLKQRSGSIVNISSVVGVKGNAGQANYAASKAGAEGMSRAMAKELGSRSITVNCVAPGFIDTDMTKVLTEDQKSLMLNQIPLARLGEPEEIAAVVGFLASDAGAYITGETIHVNGGMYV